MKLSFLALLGMVMLGCAATPKPVVHHPNSYTCVSIYWRMLGMRVRESLQPGRHYDDADLDMAIDNFNKALVASGIAQRTILQCMQFNVKQTSCMLGVYSMQGIADCEHRYASYENKEHKQ